MIKDTGVNGDIPHKRTISFLRTRTFKKILFFFSILYKIYKISRKDQESRNKKYFFRKDFVTL